MKFILGFDANKTLTEIAENLGDKLWKPPSARLFTDATGERTCQARQRQGSVPAREVVGGANRRCNQENTISQLKACGALAAPLDNLTSNGAYMLFASLAWTLKLWSGMMTRVKGNEAQKRARREARSRVIKMEFWTYMNLVKLIPAQVIHTARQRVFRLLTYRPGVDLLWTIHDHVSMMLRC